MYADVIVDISVEAVDRTFQYRIPEKWSDAATIGSSVVIPFGKGNRKMTGYIVGLSNVALFQEDRIKNIESVELGKVVVETKLLQLADFIRNNYGGTMNEALKTVLPIKKQVKALEECWLSFCVPMEEVEQFLMQSKKKNHVAKVRLIEGMIFEGGKISMSVATKKYKATKAVATALSNQGILSIDTKQKYRIPLVQTLSSDIVLNSQQKSVVDDFIQDCQRGERATYLIHGVTGSGKTEVYMEMMDYVVQQGKQVIALIPEIALTHQTVMRFKGKFGERVSILNSRMSFGERYDQYERARCGDIDVIVGPRSALFMPFPRLGLIIIDEEHENSYKSETTPKYHAREVANERGRLEGVSVILGSATPSVEAYSKTKTGEYKKYVLSERAGAGTTPNIHVVDLREEMKNKNRSIFSEKLQILIQEKLDQGQQIMLFLNRRGYAGFVSCRSCGNVLKCPHCEVSYTAHKNQMGEVDSLRCHYCGEAIPMPDKCPTCGSPYIAAFGLGTQKVEALTRKRFPNARILRMDADTTSGKNGHEEVLGAFRRGEADILIGTQMIVKGHDFPKVTLVGILAADLSMYSSDFRSGERTFQLLMQASGRAGRGDLPGDVVVQTYNPDHYAVQAVAEQDYEQFYENEMAYRRMLRYPPVWENMAILIMSKDLGEGEHLANKVGDFAKKYHSDTIEIIGPSKANQGKINDWYRYVLYIKASTAKEMERVTCACQQYVEQNINSKNCNIQFDRNPMNGY